MKHAPHHTTCELRWQCRARSCCKCNRARSLPGAAGPVRPAANSHGRALHKKHSTSKLAVELSAAGCCRCLQLAGRHYEPQPNRYESRHHDALPSTSLQRVHAAAVRPCCKCNRARSLPGAAGPVRPAANSHGRALHKKHSTSKLAVELSAAGCCRCLQLAGRHYEPQPNRYESRHHDALPSTSLQRVHAAAVRPK